MLSPRFWVCYHREDLGDGARQQEALRACAGGARGTLTPGFPSLSKLAPALGLTVRAAVRHKSELTDATASAFV